MTTVAPATPHPSSVAKFENGAEWWHALGDVPLERVVMDPPPGTATEQDLLLFVERDKRLVELIDGTLVEKPVGWIEALVAVRLITALNGFVGPRKLGVVAGPDGTLRMISGRVRLPDVTFVSVMDLPGGHVPSESIPTLPPTLAVEVLSKTNTAAEMRQKVKEYFASGSKLVWLVDPIAKTVDVFEAVADIPTRTLHEHEALDGGAVLPGFVLRLAELFAPYP